MLLRNINSILFKVLCCFFVLYPNGANLVPGEKISYNLVHSWADKLGMELFHLGDFITRRKEVQESFKQAQVVSRAGAKIVENMANEIKTMMDSKISAVRRIMDTAENTALTYQSEKPDKYFSYYNSKEMIEPHEPIPTEPPRDLEDAGGPKIFVQPKEIVLTPKAEFFNTPVNMSVSSVHVPTNVYDRASDTIKAIEWSENLDQIFRDNYKKDPTLSWQFFGSSTGFMRQFPASKWKADPVDLYDCRLRSWFMEAATSPKDVIILLDGSGSMTGQRLDIAKHVVNTILDTLGTNDFVNIFTFSDKVKPVVGCFEDTLVQANLGNIRELKEGIELVKTVSIANFSAALTKAFEVLEQFKTEQHGAQCNQAIMIVSDGAPFSYEEIFETYNWQNLPYKPVRVFTYLIGKEVADVKDIKWMACANQGFYVHLSDTAEVREMVLNYIPVMARPLVLGRHDHPVVWTQVYADVVDMEMSDYLWQLEQNADQKENILEYRKVSFRMLDPDEVRRREYRRMKKAWDQPTESDDYHFMTTISMPVYDRRENANITELVLINEALWELQTRETKIANLLGVAGTDVPIRDIKKLLSPFLLGVNGYAFIVTNNGYILFHPDFRPIFQRYILKPAYNSVDMIEVELLDDDRPPRDFNPVLLTIRDSIINQSTGSKWMLVKNHFDEMKRVARVKRQYYWTAIQNTPFTLVITYPELYGVYRLQIRTEDEIHRMNIKGSNTLSYFTGKRWKIHPKWLFCKHSNMTFETPEEELLWFLGKMSQPGWKWPSSRSALPPEHTAAMLSNSSAGRIPSFDKDNYYCDRQLMQSLVFDARVTEWFSKNTSFNSKDDKGSSSASNPISVLMGLLPRNEFKQRFGITVAFLATHSGLTRWQEFHSNMAEELGAGESFSEHNNKAIDEIWYKRAVDQHFVREESFVYSVPFDAGETAAETIVTASHAVFHTEGGKSAPAAVVGFQFQHSALLKLFRNITGNACAVDDKDCYVLDNNGFIIISPSRHETGRFFGEINGAIMHRLVEENVYKRVTVYDYQAVCFVPDGDNNSSSNVLTPLFHLLRAFKWLITTIVLYLVEVSTVAADFFEHYVDENMTDYTVNVKNNEWVRLVTLQRTRLKPCDMQRDLYTLYNEKDNVVYNMTAHGCERPFVVLPIPASNLILLVIDQMCPRDATHILTVNPMDINYPLEENQTLACFKRDHEFSRVRPISCISRHVNESNIELCGNASSILINTFLFLITISLNRLL
ncbi:voltage-dependent calcium channel subunit alpha-2/delta-3 isoform X1 [Lucilia cuprina]|uniref:voltage-dependent calcium channel subunit alpha-2/delta-3 isoform X1 n=1 Tax=Lucilia cuprina TaxID=7375 RepID=UPI001F064D72|nr:voltage-dependent calcium channel subunit alpha-2/delta-3 isoform X1 [Lucilia cuprina]